MSTGAKPKFVVRDAKTGVQVGKALESRKDAEEVKRETLEESEGTKKQKLEVKQLITEGK